jgi:Mg2+ and Co2+ transporter CorA
VAALCDHSAKDTMMIIAYALDCGRLHPVNMPTVDEDAAGTMPGAVWLDLEKPDAPDYAAAARATGLTLPAPDDITEIEASSRLVSDDPTDRLARRRRLDRKCGRLRALAATAGDDPPGP